MIWPFPRQARPIPAPAWTPWSSWWAWTSCWLRRCWS